MPPTGPVAAQPGRPRTPPGVGIPLRAAARPERRHPQASLLRDVEDKKAIGRVKGTMEDEMGARFVADRFAGPGSWHLHRLIVVQAVEGLRPESPASRSATHE